jgi:CBS domain-containing protein
VDEFFVAHGFGSFPVVDGEAVVGLITVEDVQTIPQGLWSWRTVGDVMRPASPELFITPDRSMMQAMEQMVRTGFERLVVMEDGRWIGLITRSAVAQFLRLHTA